MGYRTNALVSTLTSQLRMSRSVSYQATILFVTSFETASAWKAERPAFVRFFNGASRRADALGYKMEEFWIKSPGFTRHRIQKILQARNIRGLLIAPMPHPIGHIPLDWSRYASVTLGFTMASPHLDCARNHHYHAITLSLRKLRHSGHKRIGLALRPQSYKFSDGLFAAPYLYHAHITGVAPLPIFCQESPNDSFTEENFRKWYYHNKPDSVICMGSYVHTWCENIGISVPNDLSIVDLDIHDFSTDWSGIDGREEETAAAGVDLVVQRLQQNVFGLPDAIKAIFIEGRWIEGATIAKRESAYS